MLCYPLPAPLINAPATTKSFSSRNTSITSARLQWSKSGRTSSVTDTERTGSTISNTTIAEKSAKQPFDSMRSLSATSEESLESKRCSTPIKRNHSAKWLRRLFTRNATDRKADDKDADARHQESAALWKTLSIGSDCADMGGDGGRM